jgi:trypsin-like peptidase
MPLNPDITHFANHAFLVRDFGNPRFEPVRSVPGALPPSFCTGLLLADGCRRFGGCIRVSEEWILTAHHVIDIADLARHFRARFAYLNPAPDGFFEYPLDPDRGFFTSEDGIQGPSGDKFELDYAFIRLRGPFDPEDPSFVHPPDINTAPPVKGTPARIPQHRNGGILQIARESSVEIPLVGLVTAFDDKYVFHRSSTTPGVSGSPIFDFAWKLIGVHTHGRRAAIDDALRRENGWGTRITAIVDDARRRGFNFPQMDWLNSI